MIALFGLLQFGAGIAATVEFTKDESHYGPAYSAAAIISPFALIGKAFVIPARASTGFLFVTLLLDLLCDGANALCSLLEDLPSD